VSQNITLIKSYLKSIRAHRSTNGNTTERKPLYCPYVEIRDRQSSQSSYLSDVIWGNEDVNARGLNEGGVYVIYTKDTFIFNNGNNTHTVEHEYSKNFWQSVYQLAKLAGVELKKVYGIHPRTDDSVWFKEAIENSKLTNL